MDQKSPKKGPDTISDRFAHAAARLAWASGSWWVFFLAVLLLVVWGITGPYYHYSDTWQLVANTATSLITFLMVFLIQSAQNRDSKAMNLKLDELIRAMKEAHDELIDIEHVSDEELKSLAQRYERIRAEYEHRRKNKPAA